MNREGHENIEFFVGTEVEHVPTIGMKTLFVVGIQDPEIIAKKAKKAKCKAIYFGANQSFELDENLALCDSWKQWEDMIESLLNKGYWCLLDLDIKYAGGITESVFACDGKFIPVISAKLPYIEQLGYNAVLKIDDTDFNKSNPGVWVHRIHDLMDKEVFTHWSKYDDDKEI